MYGQRRDLLVPGGDLLQVRAPEEPQHRQVRLPVPSVRGGVDEPRPPVGAPQHVPVPEVAVEAGRRLGGTGDRREPRAGGLHHGRVVRGQRASVDGRPDVRQHPLLGVPVGPLGAGDVPHRGESDVRLTRTTRRTGPVRGRPGSVQRREPPPQPQRGPDGGRTHCDPFRHQPPGVVPVHLRHRHHPRSPQPPQPGGLRAGRVGSVGVLGDHGPAVGESDLGDRAGEWADRVRGAAGEARGGGEGVHMDASVRRPTDRSLDFGRSPVRRRKEAV
ncbi:hypothetical protein Saa2_06851 [Streptomyces acidiscabies]|nr:hypothetical protein Saa2_06851 [Streptomyces acidiscabies]